MKIEVTTPENFETKIVDIDQNLYNFSKNIHNIISKTLEQDKCVGKDFKAHLTPMFLSEDKVAFGYIGDRNIGDEHFEKYRIMVDIPTNSTNIKKYVDLSHVDRIFNDLMLLFDKINDNEDMEIEANKLFCEFKTILNQ